MTQLTARVVQNADVIHWIARNGGATVNGVAMATELDKVNSNLRRSLEGLRADGVIALDLAGPDITAELTPMGVAQREALLRAEGPPDTVPLNRLRPNPNNPRRHRDEADDAGMVVSVGAKGVLQPLVVLPADAEGVHTILFGHRRFAAALAAVEQGLQPQGFEVPIRVKDVDEAEAQVLMMTENLQRADMDPVDEGMGWLAVCRLKGWSVREAAEQLGKSKTTVHERVQIAEHAPARDVEAYRADQITYRELRQRAAAIASPKDALPPPPPKDPVPGRVLLAVHEIAHKVEHDPSPHAEAACEVGHHWRDGALQEAVALGHVILSGHGEGGWSARLTETGRTLVRAVPLDVDGPPYRTAALNPPPPGEQAQIAQAVAEAYAADMPADEVDDEAETTAAEALAEVEALLALASAVHDGEELGENGPTVLQVCGLFEKAERPLPWRTDAREVGQLWAANGEPVACADANGELPNALAMAHAQLIVLAVNRLGGFRPVAAAEAAQ